MRRALQKYARHLRKQAQDFFKRMQNPTDFIEKSPYGQGCLTGSGNWNNMIAADLEAILNGQESQ